MTTHTLTININGKNLRTVESKCDFNETLEYCNTFELDMIETLTINNVPENLIQETEQYVLKVHQLQTLKLEVDKLNFKIFQGVVDTMKVV